MKPSVKGDRMNGSRLAHDLFGLKLNQVGSCLDAPTFTTTAGPRTERVRLALPSRSAQGQHWHPQGAPMQRRLSGLGPEFELGGVRGWLLARA